MRPGVLAVAASAVTALACTLVAAPAPADDTIWTRVGTGSSEGVSGITATPDGGWLTVRDAKLAGQARLALLDVSGRVTPLVWPGTPPADLEAVDAVPGKPGRYAVVTSGGAGRVVSVSGTTVQVVRSFTLPVGRNQNEGFASVRTGSTTIAVWGNRGSTSASGRLYAAIFNPTTGTFGAVVQGTVSVPYPTSDVRHISDVEVAQGHVLVTSASDPGDRGPFDSAAYDVGTISLQAGRARLALTAPRSLATYPGHKVEALACVGSTGILGTDDESQGGSTAPATFCS